MRDTLHEIRWKKVLFCARSVGGLFYATRRYERDLNERSLGTEDYSLPAISTRFKPGEIPLGSRTIQRRSAWSTCRTIVPSQGGWLLAESINTKSGPMCVMLIDSPLRISRISTWAECAP